jgi:hypothetical protein
MEVVHTYHEPVFRGRQRDHRGYDRRGYDPVGFDAVGIDVEGYTNDNRVKSIVKCERVSKRALNKVCHRNTSVDNILFASALMHKLHMNRVTLVEDPCLNISSTLYEIDSGPVDYSFLTLNVGNVHAVFNFMALPFVVQKRVLQYMDDVTYWCLTRVNNKELQYVIQASQSKPRLYRRYFFNQFVDNFKVKW